MAFVNNGTKVSLPSGKIPSGYTLPAVTEVTSTQPNYLNKSITVTKSGVENASKATTLTNIVADITSQVSTLVQADFDETANTVTVNAVLKDIRNNQIFAEEFYSNVAAAYICAVDIFVEIS